MITQTESLQKVHHLLTDCLTRSKNHSGPTIKSSDFSLVFPSQKCVVIVGQKVNSKQNHCMADIFLLCDEHEHCSLLYCK